MHGLAPDMVCQFETPPQQLTPTTEPKDSLDYVALGATAPVKNQGECSSCWAHAVTAVAEGRLKLDTGHLTSLSVQDLMDCDKSRLCKGCCGGLPERSLQWLAASPANGIASEADYPYTSGTGTDPTQGHCNKTAPRIARVTGMGIVAGDSHSMLAAATQYGVLGVAMDASPLQFYKSGVIANVSECSEVLSNHAVAIVGYGVDDGVEYWKVRNSYGAQFGEEGYFRIERFDGAQGAPCGISGCVVAATGAEYITGAAWTHHHAV